MNLNRTIFAFSAALLSYAPMAIPAYAQSLPVGDGKITAFPSRGNVFACNQNFRLGGARHHGGWLRGDKWFPLEKPHVQGKISWPNASFSIEKRGPLLDVSTNGLPVGTLTGVFPISKSDPVYVYDTNPNAIAGLAMRFSIPGNPVRAGIPGCLPMGMVGISVTGVAFYSALDDAGNDAAAHEVQDLCDGHPQGKGQYHYHSSSSCLLGAEENKHIGWALDGYPIMGMMDASGRNLSNSDLDNCHGREEQLSINGINYDYAYRLTPEYPYTLGCFSGEVRPETTQAIRAAMGPPKRRGAQANRGPRVDARH